MIMRLSHFTYKGVIYTKFHKNCYLGYNSFGRIISNRVYTKSLVAVV